MSRRAKLIITALFLALLAIPAVYVALTWHAPEPFRFRYVGHGRVVIPPIDPSGGGLGVPMVPIYIEVTNTTNHPVHLFHGTLVTAHHHEYVGEAELSWNEEPIPGNGTIRQELVMEQIVAQRLESEAFEVAYTSISSTKRRAYDFVYRMKLMVASLFRLEVVPPMFESDSTVTELVKDHHPAPAASQISNQ